MSLVGLALRMAAVRALQHDNTLAGDRVFDSAILPIDEMVSTQPQPFVVVSTNDETTTPAGRDIQTGENTIDLLIETAMARVQTLPAKDGEGNVTTYTVFETDANLELGLSILHRQIFGCLFGRGGGAWGDVFRSFVATIQKITAVRGGDAKTGLRFSARQVVVTISGIAEPAFRAVEARTPWANFLEALEADDIPAVVEIGRIVRSAIETVPVSWPNLYTAGAALAGYTEAEAEAIGIAAYADDIDTETVIPDGWENDAQAIEDQLPETP